MSVGAAEYSIAKEKTAGKKNVQKNDSHTDNRVSWTLPKGMCGTPERGTLLQNSSVRPQLLILVTPKGRENHKKCFDKASRIV